MRNSKRTGVLKPVYPAIPKFPDAVFVQRRGPCSQFSSGIFSEGRCSFAPPSSLVWRDPDPGWSRRSHASSGLWCWQGGPNGADVPIRRVIVVNNRVCARSMSLPVLPADCAVLPAVRAVLPAVRAVLPAAPVGSFPRFLAGIQSNPSFSGGQSGVIFLREGGHAFRVVGGMVADGQ